MSRLFCITVICYACCAAANGILESQIDGNVTNESVGKAPKGAMQLNLQLGLRPLKGDDRPFKLGFIHDGGLDTSWVSGKHLLKSDGTSVGGAIIFETNMYNPLHLSFGFHFSTLSGFCLGAGFNLPIIKDYLWLQVKSDFMISGSSIYLGSFPDDYLKVNGKNIAVCKVNVGSTYLLARPELNSYCRINKQMLLMAGVGFQLPWSSKVSFRFHNEPGFWGSILNSVFNLEYETETLMHNSPSVIFELDGKKVNRTNISPKGFVFNVAVVFESE